MFEFKLPDIGEGVMEGEIVAWHVAPGQSVREDDPMVEVMTDKATVTIGAPKSGTVRELRAEVGQVVPVGAVIVTLDTNGASSVASPAASSVASPAASPVASPARPSPIAAAPRPSQHETKKHAAPPPPGPTGGPTGSDGPAATAVGDIKETLPGSSFFQKPAPAPKTVGGAALALGDHFDARPLATPATRKLARDLDIDLRVVPPSGAGGRVTKDDVKSFATRGHAEAATTPGFIEAPIEAPPRASSTPARALVSIQAPSVEHAALEDRKPFVGIRRKIAERMQTSKNTAAHFTFVEECDVGRLTELRARLRPQAEAAGVRLTFLPFIVKAVVAALKKHPVLNSALDESTNELVTRRYYHVGIAAQTDSGLMVPVLKDADRKSLLDVAREIDRLGTGAREGKLATHELSGSTFTITSLGKQGGLFATPVLNFPEVGILGVHQIKQRPVVRDGAIVIGEIMLLSLSFDHRIVDGHVGAAFAYDVIGYLENPDRLFLEMA